MDKMTNKEYQKYAKKKVPKPTYFKNILFAFIVGGIICVLGQIIRNILFNYGLNEKTVASATSILLIFLGSFLTGLGLWTDHTAYPKLVEESWKAPSKKVTIL